MRCCQHLVKSMNKRAPVNLGGRAVGGGRTRTLASYSRAGSFSSCSISRAIPPLTSAGLLFDLHRSQAHEWMHRLQKVLEAALGKKMVLPERKIDSIEAFLERFSGVKRDVNWWDRTPNSTSPRPRTTAIELLWQKKTAHSQAFSRGRWN